MLYRAMIAALLLATSAAAFTQPLPDIDTLADHVAASVPPYWSIIDFRIVAQDDLGDAARPRAVVRFEADATPSTDLYSRIDTIEPFALVVPTQQAAAQRVLYGVIDLSYRAGEWSADVLLENPVTALGQPVDMFTEPTLVVGSSEAEALLQSLHQQREAIAIAEHQHALAELTTAQNATLERLRNDHDRTMQQLRTEHQHALANLEQELHSELAALTDGLEPRLAEARSAWNDALAEAEVAHAEAMHALRLEQEDELEALRIAHAQHLGELRVRQRQEIAALEEQLDSEREQLELRIGASADIIRLQQELTENLAVQREGATALIAAFNDIRTQRRNFFAALPTEWTGVIHCQDEEHGVDWAEPAVYRVEDASTNSLRGDLIFGEAASSLHVHSRYIFSVVATDSALTLPLTLVGGAERERRRSGLPPLHNRLDVSILEDGTWVSTGHMQFRHNNEDVWVLCRLEMGSQ